MVQLDHARVRVSRQRLLKTKNRGGDGDAFTGRRSSEEGINQKRALDQLGKQLKFNQLDDWYGVTAADFQRNGGEELLGHHGNDPVAAVKSVYANHRWVKWKFKHNQEEYMRWLGKELAFTRMSDWYAVTTDQFRNHHGSGFLSGYHNDSPSRAVMNMYPQHSWLEWKFNCTPKDFWSSTHNQERFMEWLGKQLVYSQMDDWYSVTVGHIYSYHGRGLLGAYNGSPSQTVMAVYPNHSWLPWKFAQTPSQFWCSEQNQKKFVDWLGSQLQVIQMSGWYSVTAEHFFNNHGSGFLSIQHGSPSRAVMVVYPDHPWLEWKFAVTPKDFWKFMTNQERYMNWLGQEQKIVVMSDWYSITQELIAGNLGGGFLAYHNHSPARAVMAVYPDHPWLEWRFVVTPKTFWSCSHNQRRFMDWLGTELQFTQMSDWYTITAEHFFMHYGRGFLNNHNCSPSQAVMTVYSQHPWLEWKFTQAPSQFWASAHNQKRFMDWLGNQLQFMHMHDWYSITQDHFHKHHGAGLLVCHYHDSPSKAVMSVYTLHPWIEWKFNSAAKDFWSSLSNQRRYMDWLGSWLEFVQMHDWYAASQEHFYNHDGFGLLTLYNSSPSRAVMSVYPHHTWLEWKFKSTPKQFWSSIQNQKRYLEWLGNQLAFTKMADWYSATVGHFHDHYGKGLLNNSHQGKPANAVMALYPEHHWLEWKFRDAPCQLFHNIGIQTKFLHWVGNSLALAELPDWYKVHHHQLSKVQGFSLFMYQYKSFAQGLAQIYPHHSWDYTAFSDSSMVGRSLWKLKTTHRQVLTKLCASLGIQQPKDWTEVTLHKIKRSHPLGNKLLCQYGHSISRMLSSLLDEVNWEFWPKFGKSAPVKQVRQQELKRALQSLGLGDLKVEYCSVELVSPSSNRPIQLDLYSPSHKLAVEYQGEHHYYLFKDGIPGHSLLEKQRRDEERRLVCSQNGIKLIHVPYWWDRKPESLIGTIREQYPELLQQYSHVTGLKPIADPHASQSRTIELMTGTNWENGYASQFA